LISTRTPVRFAQRDVVQDSTTRHPRGSARAADDDALRDAGARL